MRGNCYLYALEALFDLYATLSTTTISLATSWCAVEVGKRQLTADNVPELGESPLLVHGFIKGDYGKLQGVKFGHAWIEGNGMVMDCGSAEKCHCLVTRDQYYDHWQIDPNECNRYTIQQATQRIIATGSDSEWNDHAPDVLRVELDRIAEAAQLDAISAFEGVTPSRKSN
jgi:hypothetical protein